jgi:hypothetical protein
MSSPLFRRVRWFAILLPLFSTGLSACVVVPARPVVYYGDRDGWSHDRDGFWGRERHDWR